MRLRCALKWQPSAYLSVYRSADMWELRCACLHMCSKLRLRVCPRVCSQACSQMCAYTCAYMSACTCADKHAAVLVQVQSAAKSKEANLARVAMMMDETVKRFDGESPSTRFFGESGVIASTLWWWCGSLIAVLVGQIAGLEGVFLLVHFDSSSGGDDDARAGDIKTLHDDIAKLQEALRQSQVVVVVDDDDDGDDDDDDDDDGGGGGGGGGGG
eukprot:960156-Rhodomonas_salina.1